MNEELKQYYDFEMKIFKSLVNNTLKGQFKDVTDAGLTLLVNAKNLEDLDTFEDDLNDAIRETKLMLEYLTRTQMKLKTIQDFEIYNNLEYEEE